MEKFLVFFISLQAYMLCNVVVFLPVALNRSVQQAKSEIIPMMHNIVYFHALNLKQAMYTLKISIFILFLLNFAAPVFQSCYKETSKATNKTITLENLVNTYNEGILHDHEKAILAEGDMIVITLPSKEVLFFLKKDGSNTYEMFLGQGTELSSMAQKEMGKVKVAYLREALAVETEEGEVYTFTIGQGKGNDIIRKLSPNWSGKGYGLAYIYNEDINPLAYKGLTSTEDIRAAHCKCRLQTPTTDWSDCDSGGEGSTSCSISAAGSNPGCSVSCNTADHYFACCTDE